jgi:N-formylglutamate amidohydrolase
MTGCTFTRFNDTGPVGPVIISVPHAGRDYADFPAQLRVSLDATLPLEDRYADRLVETAITRGVSTIVAHAPRLVIDLNRAPDDLDPSMIRGNGGGGTSLSAKARGGLGLIPARLAGTGSLWRTPFDATDVEARIATIYRPYHKAIGNMLSDARTRWNGAILLDLHSMPTLEQDDAPDIVIGDRFGRTAASHITEAAAAFLSGAGFRVACNTPYAGGHIVGSHANPAANIHALQVEIDRRLYLDGSCNAVGAGLNAMQSVIVSLVDMLSSEITGRFAAAAE